MEKNLNNDYDLEELVFKVFLKHIKNHKLYVAFRLSVNHNNSIRDIFHIIYPRVYDNEEYCNSIDRIYRIGSAFNNANSFQNLLGLMRACNGGRKLKVSNDGKFQMAIMQMVNNLLHSCVEYKALKDGNMKSLQELGATIFKEVCQRLFGDSFEDKTEEAIDPRQKKFLSKMAEMGGTPSFENIDKDFLRMLHDQIRNRTWEESEENTTSRYRRVPRTPWFDDDDDLMWL